MTNTTTHIFPTQTLFNLAKEMADFSDLHTENLNFEDYSSLIEYEAKLLAFGNLLCTSNQEVFLQENVDEATECLQALRLRLSPEGCK